MISIRDETPGDIPAIHSVNALAFERPEEARLVDKLRAACPGALSLVAEQDGQIAGHILFTPVAIDGCPLQGGMGLAPLAVLPERQRQGIGSRLVQAGLARLRQAGCPYAIVLGHPAYYPRFGFQRASHYGLRSQWEGVPDEAFMALELQAGALQGVSGVARYRSEFDEAM
ncbi:MAG: N-acetyltransferase [Chloroflexota bacterium]